MKIIVGLGNPGVEYERTRHNVGFMAVDALADRHSTGAAPKGRFHAATLDVNIGDERCLLVKPTTYMNRSGQSVSEVVRFYKIEPAEDLLIIVDDVALPAGVIRLRGRGSAGGHNGLADIEQKLGDDQYSRCRIGIDSPGAVPQRDYVLQRIAPDQQPLIRSAIDRAADAAEIWATIGLDEAMNRFNVRASEEKSPGADPGENKKQRSAGAPAPSESKKQPEGR